MKNYMEYIFYKLFLLIILIIIILYYLNNKLNDKDFFTNKNDDINDDINYDINYDINDDINDDIKNDINLYIGITSIPIRLKYIHNTLNSLLNQDVKPTKIFVFLPDKSIRLKIDYNINDIQKDKINDPDNIIEYVTGINDEGPITKFYPLLDHIPKNKNNFLLVADDDIIYPKSRIQDIKKYINVNSNNSYGFSGRKYFKNNKNKEDLKFYTNIFKEVDILEGFDIMAFPRNIFPDNSDDFLKWVKTLPEKSFFVDDIVLSKWCDLNNSKRFIYSKQEGNKYYGDIDDVPDSVKKVQLLNDNFNGRNMEIYKVLFDKKN